MRCPKEITSDDIINNLSDDDINFNLASCEQSCDNYSQLFEDSCNNRDYYHQ